MWEQTPDEDVYYMNVPDDTQAVTVLENGLDDVDFNPTHYGYIAVPESSNHLSICEMSPDEFQFPDQDKYEVRYVFVRIE